MDGDSATSSGLEWQNLALYSNKPMQIFGFPSSNELYPVSDNPGRDFGVPDPTIGLRLGHQKEYGEAFSPAASSRSLATTPPSSSMPVSSTPAKRSRASYHNMQNPCCQVEGCNLDLKLAKDYHRRHRICESHSKSPKVIVAGMERRFCQQCSRFHDLSEFDDKKRSCRRRLSDHNARRRRVQPESIQLSSPGISPALYADQRQQNVLLNGLPVSLPSSTWENASSSMARHSLMRPSKVRGLEGTLNDDVLHQCLHVASNNSSMAPDLMSAHSLLSSTSWSLNEGESSSMEGIVQGSYAAAHSEPDSHHLTLFQSHNVGLDQGPPPQPPQPPPPPSMNMQNAGSSHHQEYQLFKPPYHSGSFYSTQRSL